MTDGIPFGQRIAMVWRELTEHLNEQTRREIAESEQPRHTSEEEENNNDFD